MTDGLKGMNTLQSAVGLYISSWWISVDL